ncbi:gliding motility-associated C-terminal domain-containing protein [Aureivirga sp. CE67]|uniref:T9SS type B sorting domain-containing protein n=1 Tax=Aureivirga sp. CE67 TaxID=1788983 RepID=UPI0018CA0682|nr:gliding motility-associated C-terminal domain-containing protein [Aureivirga sp. CE67]
MKKNFYLFVFLFSIIFNCFSQKEGYNWYFGGNAGITFNTDPPSALSDGQLNTHEGCSSISDSEGNLLFYSHGTTIYNQNNLILMNGDELSGGNSSTHSAVFLEAINSDQFYYLFTVDQVQNYPSGLGLRYSKIDKNLNGGLGAVIADEKDILIHQNSYEKLAAYFNGETNTYWIVTIRKDTNQLLTYKLTESGVESTFVVSELGDLNFNGPSFGYMKFSPDGKKLAIANWEQGLWLLDFDKLTGEFSNPIQLSTIASSYGIEFSANSKVLYASYWGEYNYIEQYNLSLENTEEIISSKINIFENTQEIYYPRALQLGPDLKIYFAINGLNYLSVIHNPNDIGTNIEKDYVFLGDDKYCTSGLPTFQSSLFLKVDFDVENLCFGDSANFYLDIDSITNIEWNFGDSVSEDNISNDVSPTHVFSSPGDFEVTLKITIGYESYEVNKNITIYEVPHINEINDFYSCENDSAGIGSFDTSSVESTLIGNQENVEVSYFDQEGNELPTPFPDTFETNSQTISAVLTNTLNENCTNETSIIFEVNENPYQEPIPDFFICKGEATEFNILEYVEQNDFSYNQDIYEYSFYISEENAQFKENSITFISQFQEEETIYIRIENKTTECYDISSFEIKFKNEEDCEELMIEIPEGFSPNGDGINDLFVIKNLYELYPNYKIEFYNRWGNKVYTDEKGKHWNGQLDGDKTRAAAGVYFFVLDFNDGDRESFQSKLYLNK